MLRKLRALTAGTIILAVDSGLEVTRVRDLLSSWLQGLALTHELNAEILRLLARRVSDLPIRRLYGSEMSGYEPDALALELERIALGSARQASREAIRESLQ